MPLRVLRRLPLLLLFAISALAKADLYAHVDLVCNAGANLALVRFTEVENDEPPMYPRLPETLDHGLSASTGSDRTDCTLADGTTIRVRGGEEQAFAYGMGGGNPPAFFSIWINQRKVLSRHVWKPGYQNSFNDPKIYDGVLIANGQITICATAGEKPQHCSSKPLNLSKSPIDRIEYGPAAQKLPVGHISVIAKGTDNRRFCKDYLDHIKPRFDKILNGFRTSLDIDISSLATETTGDESRARSGLIEVLPGITQRLVMWEREDHYFDGTVIALGPSSMTMQSILAAYPFEDNEAWPTRPPPPGVTLISGGQKQLYPAVSPRYVRLLPQRIGGALYFLAYPTNRLERPTAALVKPLADGRFITLCAFNRTEPHY